MRDCFPHASSHWLHPTCLHDRFWLLLPLPGLVLEALVYNNMMVIQTIHLYILILSNYCLAKTVGSLEWLEHGKVLAHAVTVCSCVCSSPVTLTFEPVVEINPLLQDTGPLWHLSFHSLLCPDFPKYPFINQSIWEEEKLGKLCANCPHPGSNLGQRIRSETC